MAPRPLVACAALAIREVILVEQAQRSIKITSQSVEPSRIQGLLGERVPLTRRRHYYCGGVQEVFRVVAQERVP